ncbi:MAG TPA: ThuA domain-containing protein [Saprospiraceae bacterium]|nr:ThuA domain-containing protein [Saprospiraceae bacterium]HMQ82836.1 ThuA domain-containing protein [Saprospiraceae bacterium]
MRWITILTLIALSFQACQMTKQRPVKVLVFSKTAEFRHESIEAGIAALRQIGKENGYEVIATEDPEKFDEVYLKDFSLIVFLNTTGDVLNNAQQADMERFIQAGGGFVGIHAATDTEYDWPWYGGLVGAHFAGHPEIQAAQLNTLDKKHPATKHLPDTWERTDEWYNLKDIQPGLNVLLNIDETSYKGGTNGENHPMAWYQEYDGGRAFYTAGGHTEQSYSEPLFLKHLLGGMQYAIGKNQLDYAKCRSHRLPEESRFSKTVLHRNMDEPMEFDLLPDGRILVVERKGAIKLFDPKVGLMVTASFFPVHTEHEDGLLGIAVDPNYKENHWVYLCYSPVGDIPKQHLSRFEFFNDSLHFSTEKVLLEIPVQREECCHSGGSVEFGPDGLLYVSIGDNTNPFASDGFAPIDERPGRSAWDAQRSSANTNDLRGKILRIKPEKDGSYSIPPGNLFPPGTPNTRPEIYVMGCRNPFRISIDSKRNWLYWGDVGPDSGKDEEGRGPKGYDGVNVATKPGFWGWPYSRGNNTPYNDFDFTNEQPGPLFDPLHPINNSPNNTGLRELPATQPYTIWYSYDESQEFPWVGTGGKNPMAGPVYYSDQYQGEHRFPPFFDGKLIIYEWMRHWLYAVELDSMGGFVKADPIMPNGEFSRPMDMLFGHDGSLYVLEYGELWFSRNQDARLSRIDYNWGNQKPVAQLEADQLLGAAPLNVAFSAEKSLEYDGEALQYEWYVNGRKIEATGKKINHRFDVAGEYVVELKVTDPKGNWDKTSETIAIGNQAPVVNIALAGNKSFFWEGRQIDYRVSIEDKEDGAMDAAGFPLQNAGFSIDYLAEGLDLTVVAAGHQKSMEMALLSRGAKLIDQSDCKNCHAIDKKVNGPSYIEVAQRYADNKANLPKLAQKIINGGSGVWGETVMSAHPTLSESEATDMVAYIFSLVNTQAQDSGLPLKGQLVTNRKKPEDDQAAYVLMATYTDLGNGERPSITRQDRVILRQLKIEAEKTAYDSPLRDYSLERDENLVGDFKHGRYLVVPGVDMTDMDNVTLRLYFSEDAQGGTIALKLNSTTGEELGKAAIKPSAVGYQELEIPVKASQATGDLYLVFTNEAQRNAVIGSLDWLYFQPKKAIIN